ncbi:MAG: DUF2510 domain-containing protein [Actinobacteria bacterium]|nr:DUF2510 domain-containing protein [Actinomycetota bacterium]
MEYPATTAGQDLIGRNEMGWHPDPTHRFEFRYHNGQRWTADVARGGIRYVDATAPPGWRPPSPMFAAHPSRAMAVTALVFAICSLVIAWVPFLFVVGAAGAIVAFVLSAIVLRRSKRYHAAGQPAAIGQGLAVAALITAIAASGLCVVGFQLTRIVLREVDELVNPGPYTTTIDRCETVDGHVVAEGSIHNRDAVAHGYTVTVVYHRGTERWDTTSVQLSSVAAGATVDFTAASGSTNFSSLPVTCEIDSVYGPAPFSN